MVYIGQFDVDEIFFKSPNHRLDPLRQNHPPRLAGRRSCRTLKRAPPPVWNEISQNQSISSP